MALPVTIPNEFANATASIPLSQLDTNFNTLANAVNGISDGSESLANVSVTGGTISNVAVSATTLNTSGAVVFNDAGADVDFRVEGDADANLLFVDASTDRVGIGTASPAVAFDVVGQVRASTGILFGTDTAAANALDDYEEGTWTPTYQPVTGAFSTITYDSARSGRYTKIGNTVFVQGMLRTDAITVGTASGAVQIAGLPFTTINANPVGSISINYATAFGGDMPNGCSGVTNSTEFGLWYRTTANAGSLALDVTDLGTGANANYIIFEGFYTVA